MTHNKASNIIKLDKATGQMAPPVLLLKTSTLETIASIRYTNLHLSLNANAVDEISFEVHKYNNGIKCPYWEHLIDLKVVDLCGYGQFKIKVSYSDNTETVKTVTGQSLECELGQIYLHDFHANDSEDMDMQKTVWSADAYDDEGAFIPVVLYNPENKKRSLLHMVLEKAPHWTVCCKTDYVVPDTDKAEEQISRFQRTFSADGTDIYSFLTATVAAEANVVFAFDTYHRTIYMYSLYPGRENLAVVLGEDTTVLLSKNKLANQISIESNADSIKNCFRISGGDDIINDYIGISTIGGGRYIYEWDGFERQDMPEDLRNALDDYRSLLGAEQDNYKTSLQKYTEALEQLAYYEHTKMPNIPMPTNVKTSAKEQYQYVIAQLQALPNGIGVYDTGIYDSDKFTMISNNVAAMAEIFLDSRYEVQVIPGTDTYTYDAARENIANAGSFTGSKEKWHGVLRITRTADSNDTYPTETDVNLLKRSYLLTLPVTADNDAAAVLPYTEQKLLKALHKASMSDIDAGLKNLTTEEIRQYYDEYSLTRLQGFAAGYQACVSTLCKLNQTTAETTQNPLYETYTQRLNIVEALLEERRAQIAAWEAKKSDAQRQIADIQDRVSLASFLNSYRDDMYLDFCKYRREDAYTNANYISDACETDADILNMTKELLSAAQKELKRACMLQRTISASVNNLFALSEFAPLWDKFDLFNYIRVKTEDELFKLRLISISADFAEESFQSIDVKFSENVLSLSDSAGDTLNDAASLLQQAGSIVTAFPSVSKQASQGIYAYNAISAMYEKGLNAANTMLKNSDDNEVILGSFGLLCRRMDDEGNYGQKQLRLIGNGMYLTDNAWKSVSMAVGELYYTDPTTGESQWKYGVLAPALVGKLLVGENLYIANENGSVRVTGDGIDIRNGKMLLANSKNKIEINPDNDSLFSIKKSDDTDIFCLNSEGDGYFKGKIIADSISLSRDITIGTNMSITKDGVIKAVNGEFSGKIKAASGSIGIGENAWNIGENALWNGCNSINSTNAGTYIGTDGIRQYKTDEKYVDIKDGILSAVGCNINGTINGGSININNRFMVDEAGNVTLPDNAKISWGNVDNKPGNIAYTENIPTALSQLANDAGYQTSAQVTQITQNAVVSGLIAGNNIIASDTFGMKIRNATGIAATALESIGYNIGTLYPSYALSVGSGYHSVEISSIAGLSVGSIQSTNIKVLSNITATTVDAKTVETQKLYLSGDTTTTPAIRPLEDNKHSCGSANYRWSTVYAKDSTINTSDKNSKKDFSQLIDDERYLSFFENLMPMKYRFIDGTSGRVHVGFISQDVEQAMQEAGLTDLDFAGFCKDKKAVTEVSDDGKETEIPQLDENGNQIYIYSLRYSEFIALNTAMIQKCLKEIASLKQQIIELQEKPT